MGLGFYLSHQKRHLIKNQTQFFALRACLNSLLPADQFVFCSNHRIRLCLYFMQ